MNSNEPKQSQTKPRSSKMGLIIVLVIIGSIIVLGIAGYFGWKYISSKYLASKTGSTASPSISAGLTLSKLEEMIKYPNGILVSTDHSQKGVWASVMEMETSDPITTVNNYYLNLNSQGQWTIETKSLEADNSRADIAYVGTKDKFTVNLIIDHPGDKTSILARIDAENLPVGTPLGGSSSTPATSASASSATNSAASQNTSKAISGDYEIADSNTRIIDKSELVNLTPWQLKVARNEIYARHGRAFVHKDLQCYFATKSWYKIDPNFSESSLSSIETKNVATILAYEQAINSPLLQTDTGC